MPKWLFRFLYGSMDDFTAEVASSIPAAAPVQRGDTLSDLTAKEWDRAGLDIVYDLGLNTENSEYGGTVERCDAVLSRVQGCRERFGDKEPPKLRRAIMRWIDHYERKAHENRDDCVSGASKEKRRRERASWDEKDKRERDVRARLRANGIT